MKSGEKLYNISPPFIQNLLISLYGYYMYSKRFGGIYSEIVEKLKATRVLSKGQINDLQHEKLGLMIRHCYENVPYYQELFKSHGLKPDDIHTPGDLEKIPVLEKSTVQKNPEIFLARTNSAPFYWIQDTSGSSGTPLKIHLNEFTYKLSMALLAEAEESFGIKPLDRRATFAGRLVQSVQKNKPPFWRYNRVDRQMLFSSYHLSPRNIFWYIEKLEEFKPKEIIGYPSSIYNVARFGLDSGLKLNNRPVGVITNSETLLVWQRKVIEEFFGCPVHDYYGTAECVVFGTECAHGRYHLNPLIGITEILDSKAGFPPAKTGEVVCTSLTNYSMPLIRYRIGDNGRDIDEKCGCGLNNYTVLGGIEGRVDDCIITKDGKRVGRLDHVFKDLSGIREGQIVQENENRIVVRIVKGNNYSNEDSHSLVKNLKMRVGEEMELNLEFVAKIPRTKNGKFRGVVNLLLKKN